LSKSLAGELAPWGIRVNGLAPGWMETAMNQHDAKDCQMVDDFLRRLPLQRLGKPVDITGPALFLCSEMSSYVTGVTLPVDGGFLSG
jgi:NAD(P)-dependent dehydrogenase (short-subunit alcohol dehydrogenase family)